MLVLTRKIGEAIRIADNILVYVTDIDRDRVKIGIEAPQEIVIMRYEVITAKAGAQANGGQAPKIRRTHGATLPR